MLKARLLIHYARWITYIQRSQRHAVGFPQAQTLGLLYRYENPHQQAAISHFVQTLQTLGKHIHLLCYQTDAAPPAHIPCFTHQAITGLGRILPQHVQTFIQTPFDYLYQGDVVSHPCLDYLLARSKAKCRVGHYHPQRVHLFEIMVTCKEKGPVLAVDRLLTQMLYYTQQLIN